MLQSPEMSLAAPGSKVAIPWMEIEVSSDGNSVRVAGRGCHGERANDHELRGFSVQKLSAFRVGVGNAIARSEGLGGDTLEQARALHEAVFAGQLRDLFVALSARSNAPLLIRWMIKDPKLQAVPWEALCRPDSSHGFLASAADLVVARGVNSIKPWYPRELRRGLVVLPVLAIPDRTMLAGLELALREHIESGALELLPALEGPAARNPYLFERLRSGQRPHVLHFLGHGGFDAARNPVIRLADDDYGDRTQLPVEVFAEELRANFDAMRLIYLQACSGAKPGAFASAAEHLARSGVDAVVAYLWPVRAEVARAAARDFYTHLVGARTGSGDIGASIQASRRTSLASSADGFSPVLYLSSSNTQIFDLHDRRVRPPKRKPAAPQASSQLPPALGSLLRGSFSLVLGHSWDDEATAEIRKRLRKEFLRVLQSNHQADAATPLFSLAQRHALVTGRRKLDRLFQRTVRAVRADEGPMLIDSLARHLKPGVHTTLLWLPFLEHALARHHPNAPIYTIQPGPGDDEHRMIVARTGEDEWEEIDELPPLNLQESYVLLRLYGGSSPEELMIRPQLTEDDYIQGNEELRYIIPPEWNSQVMAWQRTQPALCVGLSALDWRHRMLLRWLYDQRPPPNGSVALLAESQDERALWATRGAGLPGGNSIAVVQQPAADLVRALEESLP